MTFISTMNFIYNVPEEGLYKQYTLKTKKFSIKTPIDNRLEIKNIHILDSQNSIFVVIPNAHSAIETLLKHMPHYVTSTPTDTKSILLYGINKWEYLTFSEFKMKNYIRDVRDYQIIASLNVPIDIILEDKRSSKKQELIYGLRVNNIGNITDQIYVYILVIEEAFKRIDKKHR